MTNLPLAEELRPSTLNEVIGQDHLVGKKGLLTSIIQKGHPLSILLWGPPGSGKTTIARLYGKAFGVPFKIYSGALHGTGEIKRWIEETRSRPLFHSYSILFLDEIHRFNKAQQDLFLPYIEAGSTILIGATTENPFFTLNNALLSRLRILELKSLSTKSLKLLVDRFEKTKKGIRLSQEAKTRTIELSLGDARHLFNLLENLNTLHEGEIDISHLTTLLQRRGALYDKKGNLHYFLISALHKSIRGSDPNAALYWFARMLEGGEDPHFIARRLMRIAIEDIGLADPKALTLSLSAWQIYERLGSPEGELGLAEAVVYLALAPKSNALYTAFSKAQQIARETSHLLPPKKILNAPISLMKKLDFGKDYQYDHNFPDGFSGQDYFPTEMEKKIFYKPIERGFEREMKKRIAYFAKLREKRKNSYSG